MEERRTIDEVIALYSLEDSIRDIYVEGKKDKNFISWFIGVGQLTGTEVYSIEDLDINNDILDKYGLSHGSNRSRVIAAAIALTEAIPGLKNALFIADRDFAEYLPNKINNDILEYTDYNSVELYAFNEGAICKMLSIIYGCYSKNTPQYYFEMMKVLRKIFAIRLANELLCWNMEWLDFNKYIDVGSTVSFQTERFMEAYLKKNSKWEKRIEFFKNVELCRKKLHDDSRLSVRGHDFTSLLCYLMNKKFKTRKINKVELFEGILLSSLDKEHLLGLNMFQRIDGFAKNDQKMDGGIII